MWHSEARSLTAASPSKTVARSSYHSPSQHAQPAERAQSLREALQRSSAGCQSLTSPLRSSLQSPAPSTVTPRKAAHSAQVQTSPLQTPRSDAMRRLAEAASQPAQSPRPSPFKSPMQRALRQAPLSNRSPAVKRRNPDASPLDTPPSTKPRRTLGATLPSACLTDLQPRKRAAHYGLSAGAVSPGAHVRGLGAASASNAHLGLGALSDRPRSTVSDAPSARPGPRRSLRAEFESSMLHTSSLLRSGAQHSALEQSVTRMCNSDWRQRPVTHASENASMAGPMLPQPALSGAADMSSAMDAEPSLAASSAAHEAPTLRSPAAGTAPAAGLSTSSARPPRPSRDMRSESDQPPTSQIAAAVHESVARTSSRVHVATGGAESARSRSPPARPPNIATMRSRRPPTHNRVPQALSRTPSLTGQLPASYRAVTPTAASPTHSVSTPAGVAPPPLEVPGAPMKKARNTTDSIDFLGRMSSLSIDGELLDLDGASFPLRATSVQRDESPQPHRQIATRRMLIFDELPSGNTP